MLAATAAEFLELQPLGRRLPVFRGRVIPFFALTTLQCDYFSGHLNQLLALVIPNARRASMRNLLFLSSLRDSFRFSISTHGLRRGLYCFAASRLHLSRLVASPHVKQIRRFEALR